jgi:hypothetical protein
VSTLDGTVALEEGEVVAVRVGEDLDFNVCSTGEKGRRKRSAQSDNEDINGGIGERRKR